MAERLTKQGRLQIELAEKSMQGLIGMGERFAQEQPFAGLRIAINLHVTKETAVLVKALARGGAEIAMTGCNAFSTQDCIVAALSQHEKVSVFAKHGCSKDEYRYFCKKVLAIKPHIIVDDGLDLTMEAHKLLSDKETALILGGCEQTTSGVIRARNMTKAGQLKFPLIGTNDNKTKHLLDNYYGTGQSVMDGILRATTLFVPSKVVVVCGYGPCGKGISLRAKGLGARVLITEIDPFAALQAVYDGYEVKPIEQAAREGDVFVTATGSKHVIAGAHIATMKDGAVLCNAGQFDYEIDLAGLRELQRGEPRFVRPNMEEIELKNGKRVNLLGGANLVNLSCAEGHPAEVMSTSFMGQALACEYLVKQKGQLSKGYMKLPEDLDDQIAALQLRALGVSFDTPTPEQDAYAKAWAEGMDW